MVEIRITTSNVILIEKKKGDVMKSFDIDDLSYIANPCPTFKVCIRCMHAKLYRAFCHHVECHSPRTWDPSRDRLIIDRNTRPKI